MKFTARSKWTFLYFREDSAGKNITPSDTYYQVEGYPTAEMMSSTPEGLAEEYVNQSLSKDWVFQLRRPVLPGDVFTCNENIYIFVSSSDRVTQTIFPESEIIELPTLRMKLLKLGQKTCKELTSRQ